MNATTNSTQGGTQTEVHQALRCSSSLVAGLQQKLIYFSAVNIFFSITAFGNFLILVALNQETSLHPPSKLLYRCLATTVGWSCQPASRCYLLDVLGS